MCDLSSSVRRARCSGVRAVVHRWLHEHFVGPDRRSPWMGRHSAAFHVREVAGVIVAFHPCQRCGGGPGTELARDEVAAGREVVRALPAEGRILTLDALYATRSSVRGSPKGGHYLVSVKRQPADASAGGAALPGAAPTHLTPRHVRTRRWLSPRDPATPRRAHAPPLPRLAYAHTFRRGDLHGSRGRDHPHRHPLLRHQLAPGKRTPRRLLQLVRNHWSIENRLHYVRDFTFDEDRSPSGQATDPAPSPPSAASSLERFSSFSSY